MPTAAITKRSIDALVRGEKDVFLWDDREKGFGAKITPAGKISYIYQYRMGGRGTATKRWTIGPHGGAWTAATARTEAERLAILVGQGIDPVDDKKRREREAATLGFTAYVDTFTDGYLKTDWGVSWPQAKRQLEMHVAPILGGKPLPSITVADLNPVFDSLRDRPALQKNVYAVVRKLLVWAEKRDDIPVSPMAKMDAPRGVRSRKRILSPEELVAIWRASFKLDDPRGHFVRLLMLSLQRRSEVAELPWAELSKADASWLLPGARAKNGQDHIVPLNALSLGILADRGWKARGLVFPSSTGSTPISNFSDIKAALDREMLSELQDMADKRADAAGDDRHPVEVAPWRVHDLRRTGATVMQSLGIPIETTERVLNHHEGGEAAGIRGVYNLHQYSVEKRRAMDAWGAWLNEKINGAPASCNVVQIAAARS